MTDKDFDPELAQLFAGDTAAVVPSDTDFTDGLDKKIDRSLRLRRSRQIVLGLFFTAVIWGLGITLDNQADFVSGGLMTPLFDLPNDKLAMIVGPANSVAGLVTLGLLGLATIARRIFVK